jgi:hypothetical protein
MEKTKAEQVRALAETISDPVFKRSLLEIAKSLELAAKYKRIDMSFLQMRGAGSIPKFALLPYHDFKTGDKFCSLSVRGYQFPDMSTRFAELFIRGDFFNDVTAMPKVMVPETVDAIVESAKEDFEEIIVAWEADWQPRKGDPIVIGRKSALYFIVATWDMTELESFVANTLAG